MVHDSAATGGRAIVRALRPNKWFQPTSSPPGLRPSGEAAAEPERYALNYT